MPEAAAAPMEQEPSTTVESMDAAVAVAVAAAAAAATAAAAAAAAAAPPPPPEVLDQATTSEMLNLPRDFLSLRPQEHTAASMVAADQQQQQQAGGGQQHHFQVKEEPVAATPLKSPLIAVHMTPCSVPMSSPSSTPVLQAKCSSTTTNTGNLYPRATATHAEVLADKSLFLDTLRRLHGSLGFKSLTIPTIGGTQLDLHLLYREVTARGGLQKVIKERIWKEIKAVFHFPPTTTNASFVLRKYYSSLLHHYEQVYFFRNEGSLVLAPGDTSSSDILSDDSDPIKRRRKRTYESTDAVAAHATNCIGQVVTGSIEGKFEHGYLVSVTVGSEKLKGVLYNVPPGEYIPQFTTTAKATVGNGNQTSQSVVAQTEEMPRKRRRRVGLRKKDPNAPKLNRSAYNFFFAEQRARIRLVQPNKEISRMIGDSWSKLTPEQRLPYQERGLVDKERYRKEIKQYRDKMKPSPNNSANAATVEDAHEEAEETESAEEQDQEDNNNNNNNNNNVDGFHVSRGAPAATSVSPNSSSQANQGQETLKFKSILPSQA